MCEIVLLNIILSYLILYKPTIFTNYAQGHSECTVTPPPPPPHVIGQVFINTTQQGFQQLRRVMIITLQYYNMFRNFMNIKPRLKSRISCNAPNLSTFYFTCKQFLLSTFFHENPQTIISYLY